MVTSQGNARKGSAISVENNTPLPFMVISRKNRRITTISKHY
jgi:hypothetical protein